MMGDSTNPQTQYDMLIIYVMQKYGFSFYAIYWPEPA